MKKNIIAFLGSVVTVILLGACSNPAEGEVEQDSGISAPTDYNSPTVGILRYVPSGSFQRDADPSNISVISRPFRVSEYEVTRAQYLAIMGSDPSDLTKSLGTSDPVQNINFYRAIAFCNKLSLAEGLTPVYSIVGINYWSSVTGAIVPTVSDATWNAVTANWNANGYRLLTEMEWMWAAMGATADRSFGYTGTGVNTTGYSKAFAGHTGSNALGNYAVFGYYDTLAVGYSPYQRSVPVGSRLPNELGLFDISGNVFEWLWDWHANNYPAGLLTDYHGAVTGTDRVLRGGGWFLDATYCFVDKRYPYWPHFPYFYWGFRVARN